VCGSSHVSVNIKSGNWNNGQMMTFEIDESELDADKIIDFLSNQKYQSLVITNEDMKILKSQITQKSIKDTIKRILLSNMELENNSISNTNTKEIDPEKLESIISDLSSMEKKYFSMVNDNAKVDNKLLSLIKETKIDGFHEIESKFTEIFSTISEDQDKGFDIYLNEIKRIATETKFNSLNHFVYKDGIENNSFIKDPKETIKNFESIMTNPDITNSTIKKEIALTFMLNPEKITVDNIFKVNSVIKNLLPNINNSLIKSQIESYLVGPLVNDNEKIFVILDNLINFYNTNPELAEQLTQILFTKDKQNDSTEMLFSIFEQEVLGKKIDIANQYILRFLSIPNAVLLESNILKDDKIKSKIEVNTKETTSIGEVAFAGLLTDTASKLTSDLLQFESVNKKRDDKIKAINTEHARLATSQSSSDSYYTVMRELFQNSKDASYKSDGITTISLNQELVANQTKGDLNLDSQKEYLHTQFQDDATGVPSFLLNYFNPFKSTKDKGDTESAGAFGCGAITINSIADKYEIISKEKDDELGTRIVVEVIKEGEQVIGTKVLKLESIETNQTGFKIDIYTEVKDNIIPELKALITSSSLIDVSDLERSSNTNLQLNINGENQEVNPDIEKVYNSDKLELIKGVKSGYWVKNIFISEINHQQNQFENALPPFISQIIKNQDLSINFKEKIELVRTRNGFSQTGERNAMSILYKGVLEHLAYQIMNGENISLPGLDENLASAFTKYSNKELSIMAKDISNNKANLEKLTQLSEAQWVSIMLYTPFEYEGNNSSLMEYFETMELIKESTRLIDFNDKQKVNKILNNTINNMSEKQREVYHQLQNSPLQDMYKSVNINNYINMGLNQEQKESIETLLTNEDLEAKYNKPNQKSNIQNFEQMFEILTNNLPSIGNPPVKYKLQWVKRNGGTDYAGSLKDGVILCKYDIKNIDKFNSDPLNDNYTNSIYDAVVHELSHTLESISGRFVNHKDHINVTHDDVFKEMMKLNFARLLGKI
jgi:hypothetical protein